MKFCGGQFFDLISEKPNFQVGGGSFCVGVAPKYWWHSSSLSKVWPWQPRQYDLTTFTKIQSGYYTSLSMVFQTLLGTFLRFFQCPLVLFSDFSQLFQTLLCTYPRLFQTFSDLTLYLSLTFPLLLQTLLCTYPWLFPSFFRLFSVLIPDFSPTFSDSSLCLSLTFLQLFQILLRTYPYFFRLFSVLSPTFTDSSQYLSVIPDFSQLFQTLLSTYPWLFQTLLRTYPYFFQTLLSCITHYSNFFRLFPLLIYDISETYFAFLLIDFIQHRALLIELCINTCFLSHRF